MLVLGFSLPKELFSGLEAGVLAHYWRRSLVKAVAARELAERLYRTAGDEAFIAGLVQDIGMLALIQQLGDSYLKFLAHLQQSGCNLLAAELENLGFDHLLLSARLLNHWGLPEGLSAAVALPPDESRIGALDATECVLPQILHLADLLARLIEQPFGSALRDLLASGGRYCGLTYETLQPVVAAVQQQVEELAAVLALELPAGTSYVDLLITSQQRLASETVTAAVMLAEPEVEGKLLALANRMRSELALAGANGRTALPSVKPQPAASTPPRPGPSWNGPAQAARRAAGMGISALDSMDPALAVRVGAAIQRCRQNRCPITLALFEVERFSDKVLQLGPAGVSEMAHWLRVALTDWTGQRAEAILVSDSCFALLFEDCPRNEAVRLARHALQEVKSWSSERLFRGVELTLSAGLATLEFPPKNYPSQELIDAAQRCLGGAQLSGGDTVKSIAF